MRQRTASHLFALHADFSLPFSAPALQLVFVLLNFAGADQRQDDLFSNSNFFSRGKSALRGLKGVENVYTQHTPHLQETLEALSKGRLRESSYPFVSGQGHGAQPGGAEGAQGMGYGYRPQEVIVFIVGGATYEEARAVSLLNASGGSISEPSAGTGTGTRFLLGGSTMLNSSAFLTLVQDAASRFPASMARPPANLGTGAGAGAPSGGQGLNLRIGPVQLNVGGGGNGSAGNGSGGYAETLGGHGGLVDPGRLSEAAQGAAQGAASIAGGLLGRLREAASQV